jgi:HlyD family secretion protein
MITIMQRYRSVAIVLTAAIVAGLCGAGLWWYESRPPPPIEWQGYADADFVKVGPTQQGLLTEVSVGRGDQVVVGTPLFVQDNTLDRAARDQASRQLRQAQEQLANLEAAGKPTEIEQAEANVADARATLERTKTDLDRGEGLARTGAITTQVVDQRRADFRSATARSASLDAALAQARAPLGRDREIMGQHDAVEAAQAAVQMAEWRLSQRRVTSPVAARVADVMARPGETIAAGAPVVSLLPSANILARFFVSETELANIHLGDTVMLACDGCRANFPATISFISPQAEYTPPVIYSEASRAKLVYTVEARPPPDRAALLNPGQPVVVRPAAKNGPQ